PVRARQVSDTVLVNEMGPYQSPTAHRRVRTTTTGRLYGDSLNGTFQMLPADGGNAIMSGTFRSKRVVPYDVSAAERRARLALTALLALYGGFLVLHPDHYGLLDSLDLPIHELGPPVFGLFGPF